MEKRKLASFFLGVALAAILMIVGGLAIVMILDRVYPTWPGIWRASPLLPKTLLGLAGYGVMILGAVLLWWHKKKEMALGVLAFVAMDFIYTVAVSFF